MEKLDWKKFFILDLLTAGLYGWYVIYRMYSDIKQMESQVKSNKLNPFLFLLLSLCTGSLFAFVVCYTYHKKSLELAKIYNIKLAISSPFIFAFITMYIPIFNIVLPIKNHNRLIDGYNSSYGFRNQAQTEEC